LKKYTTTPTATQTKTPKTKPLGALDTGVHAVKIAEASAFLTLKITQAPPVDAGYTSNFRPQWQTTKKPFEQLGLTHLNALG
jgi:hypothetical protein